jgi:hypothetical protein
MSPEQAALSGLDVDTRSDIYALGVLLYELLTGTTPFDRDRFKQAGYDEIRRILREEEPPRPSTRISTLGQAATTVPTQRKCDPRRLSQLCRGELDWIVMKCLEKDRSRRYDSATNLARDIERYLHDEPVLACPPSLSYRYRKFARRHTTALAIASVVAAALVLISGAFLVSTASVWRANSDLQRALQSERDMAYFRSIALAERELYANQAARALELLDACRPEQRGWEWWILKRRVLEEPLVLAAGIRSGLGGLAFSLDGRVLAAAYWDGNVRLWDPATGRLLRALAGPKEFVRVAFSPNGRLVAAASWNGTATVWDLAANQEQTLRGHTGRVNGVAFSPDGRHLATCSADQTVIRWDLWGGPKLVLQGHGDEVQGVAYSPNGTQLATASGPDGAPLGRADGSDAAGPDRSCGRRLLRGLRPGRQFPRQRRQRSDGAPLGRENWGGGPGAARPRRSSPHVSLQPRRPAPGLGRERHDCAGLGPGHRPGDVNAPRPYWHGCRRGLQPGWPAPGHRRTGQWGQQRSNLERDSGRGRA